VPCNTHQTPIGIKRWTVPRGGIRPALARSSPRKPSVPGRVQVVRGVPYGDALYDSYRARGPG